MPGKRRYATRYACLAQCKCVLLSHCFRLFVLPPPLPFHGHIGLLPCTYIHKHLTSCLYLLFAMVCLRCMRSRVYRTTRHERRSRLCMTRRPPIPAPVLLKCSRFLVWLVFCDGPTCALTISHEQRRRHPIFPTKLAVGC